MERGNYAASASSSPFNDGAVSPSPASQPSSFAPSPSCCSRVGRLRFKGDSILFQRQMCYPLLCVVSLSARTKCSSSRSLGCSGEKATVARALANRQLLRDLNLRSKSSSIFAACRPHNAWHSPRATLNVECGQDCEYLAYSRQGEKCGLKWTDRRRFPLLCREEAEDEQNKLQLGSRG